MLKALKTEPSNESNAKWKSDGLLLLPLLLFLLLEAMWDSFSTWKYTRKQINSSQQIYVQKAKIQSNQLSVDANANRNTTTNNQNKQPTNKKIYNGSN